MQFDQANIPLFEDKDVTLPDATFLNIEPDFNFLKRVWREYAGFSNLLIIGNGGSVQSFKAIFSILGNRSAEGKPASSQKNVVFLSTTDPEYISELKRNLKKHDTLVIAISKSGETVTQIEALMHFIDFPLLFITGAGSALEKIGIKAGAKIYPHPDVGGRYAGFTNVGLIPAAICGIDVEKLFSGAKREYAKYRDLSNPAMHTAQIFNALEQGGFVDVFMPFYSAALFGSGDLIVQLCHESFGKNGLGQTYFAHQAPESQHHTNQRFFGGRKNIAGLFVWTDEFREDLVTNIPTSMHSIPFKDQNLFVLNKIPLSYSMVSEYSATFSDAKIKGIPVLSINVNLHSTEEIGAFLAFWQMYAVYSSVLRGVNPFDQPQVESSKAISWNSRKNFKNR